MVFLGHGGSNADAAVIERVAEEQGGDERHVDHVQDAFLTPLSVVARL